MKKTALLFAVLLASLAMTESCQKFPARGELIKFSAAAKEAAATKTTYGSVSTAGDHQAITWSSGDLVDIYSSNAAVAATKDGDPSASYTLSVRSGDATFADLGQSEGLRWDESGSVTFYGVYPSGTASSSIGNFSMSIPWSQTHALGAGTLDNGYMVAKTAFASGTNDVTLEFFPVFTAFEVHLRNQQSSTLTLETFALKSESEYLTGAYTTDWTGSSRTYTVSTSSREKKAVYTFPANTTITDTDEAVFNLFLLPTDYSELYLEIAYRNSNGQTRVRRLQLKDNGSYISFAGCKKHVISGLAVNSAEFWSFSVNGNVLPWNGIDQTIKEEVSISGKVSISGAIETTAKWKADVDSKSNHYADSDWVEGGNSGYDKNYQIRTLNKDLPAAQRYFTMTFTPTAPTGGYWQLIPLYKEDDAQSPRHFRFERLLPGGGTSEDLKGQILNQQDTIRIYPVDWDPSDVNTYNVWFTCRFSTTPTFSHSINADSEFQDVHGDGRFSYWVFRIKQYSEVYPTE